MDTSNSWAMALDDGSEDQQAAPKPVEDINTPGGGRETKWKVVAKTPGLTPARIIAGRLEAEGIPTRAWQEGAGRALGLTVGLLGNGYVMVPADRVEAAEQILADPAWDEEE